MMIWKEYIGIIAMGTSCLGDGVLGWWECVPCRGDGCTGTYWVSVVPKDYPLVCSRRTVLLPPILLVRKLRNEGFLVGGRGRIQTQESYQLIVSSGRHQAFLSQSWCPFSESWRGNVLRDNLGWGVLSSGKAGMSYHWCFSGRWGGVRLESGRFCWTPLGGCRALAMVAPSSC